MQFDRTLSGGCCGLCSPHQCAICDRICPETKGRTLDEGKDNWKKKVVVDDDDDAQFIMYLNKAGE